MSDLNSYSLTGPTKRSYHSSGQARKNNSNAEADQVASQSLTDGSQALVVRPINVYATLLYRCSSRMMM